MSEIYIVALRVGPKPQNEKCNMSNHGIAQLIIKGKDQPQRMLCVCLLSLIHFISFHFIYYFTGYEKIKQLQNETDIKNANMFK